MKILVIQTASIGDVILATPVLEGLHAAFPSASIDILVKKGMEGLFRGHPFLGKLLLWDKSRKYSDLHRLMHEIRAEGYDIVINIQRFALTGLITAFSGAKIKIGFDKNPLSALFTSRVRHIIAEGVHETDRNLSLIKPLIREEQWDLIKTHRRPKLYPGKENEERVKQYKDGPYVTISPASLWFTKQFPVEKWLELIRSIPSHIWIYLLGARSDHSLLQEILVKSGQENVVNMAGLGNFLESAALMKDALMNYTNDSAPLHLASSVNAPVAAVYCSTVPGFGFGPLSLSSTVVQIEEDLKCRPCGLHGKNECPEKHFRCAMNIKLSDFPEPWEKVKKI